MNICTAESGVRKKFGELNKLAKRFLRYCWQQIQKVTILDGLSQL